jgi:hypothetical protein
MKNQATTNAPRAKVTGMRRAIKITPQEMCATPDSATSPPCGATSHVELLICAAD